MTNYAMKLVLGTLLTLMVGTVTANHGIQFLLILLALIISGIIWKICRKEDSVAMEIYLV